MTEMPRARALTARPMSGHLFKPPKVSEPRPFPKMFTIRWKCPTCGKITQKSTERVFPTDLVVCKRGHVHPIRDLRQMWIVEAIENGKN